jgi:hypothetical protein
MPSLQSFTKQPLSQLTHPALGPRFVSSAAREGQARQKVKGSEKQKKISSDSNLAQGLTEGFSAFFRNRGFERMMRTFKLKVFAFPGRVVPGKKNSLGKQDTTPDLQQLVNE